ncbi:MAG TPA: response regulator [Hansschlegelia sp.]|nr:response regulator [Hansschlegelia sp.]
MIVEDDFLVGRQLRRELEDQGAIVLGPAANDREALRIANDAAAPIDIALLDLDLNGVSAVPVAMALADRRVPTVVVTGCGALDLPPRLKDIPICHKPASIRQIAAALAVFHQP